MKKLRHLSFYRRQSAVTSFFVIENLKIESEEQPYLVENEIN